MGPLSLNETFKGYIPVIAIVLNSSIFGSLSRLLIIRRQTMWLNESLVIMLCVQLKSSVEHI